MITSSIIESFTVHFFLPFLNFVTFFLFFLFFKMEDLFFITSKKKKLVSEEFIETTENKKDNQKDEYFFTLSKNKLIKNKNNLSSIETFSSYMSHTKRCALNNIENEEKEKIFSSHLNNVVDTYKKTNTETTCSDKITVLINKEKSNNNKNIHSNNNIYYNDNILYNNDTLLKNNDLKEPLKIHQPLSTPIHNEKKNLIYSNNIFYKYYMNNYQEEKNVVHTNNNYNLHSDNTNYAIESISNNNSHMVNINNMNNMNNNSNNVSVNMAKDVLRAWYCDHDNPNEIIDSKNYNIESIKTQNVYETNNNNDMNPFFNSTMDFKSNKFIDNKTDQSIDKPNDNISDQSIDKPNDNISDQSIDKPNDNISDQCVNKPSNNKSNINNEEYFQNFIVNKNNNLRDTIISDENNKMIIIKKVDDERNMQDDNFSYLHDILEKTYKEYINFDGSEYIYIYDICVSKDRINNNNDNNNNDNNNNDNNNIDNIDNIDNNIYDDNYYYDENNITSDAHINNNIHNNNMNHSQNKIIIDNSHKNEYNIFNNISMKINKIKGFFISTNKLTEDQSNISTDILQITKQIRNDMTNKEMILYNDNYMEKEKLHIHNINETNIQNNNNKKEIIKHNDIQFEDKKEIIKCVDKTSFIDKLNYIFFTSINNNNNTTNDNNNNYNNDNNDNNENIYNNHNNDNIYNNHNNYKSYNFHIKEVSQDYHFEDINFDNIHNNMNHNINRRIYETDIYDIHIIKKGYNYIYIKDGEWKHFFCVLFYLQNNIGLKNDIICKHYCKIYDRGDYILKKINDNNSSDIYTNYFLSFFEDIYFNKHQLNNLELAILIKKKSYEFIFEITKYKTADIIHNFHYIYIDQDKKTNNCLNIFDVDNNSYYIIPFIFKTTQTYHNKQNIHDEEKQNNEHLINHINFSCDILKHWNECIYFITKKKMEATSHPNLTNLKKNQNKIRYVNRKLNQWIHVFKQERNIKHL
ncbi:conserved Plasmodium protein, unknown function [Plasmodium gaboni]|uniref:Uncharacterized protein n=1 Tax=Plasmodium gaboni TaxID=647221 RepID=A0ABY1UJH1_9APIC|nr:conserved Plasmodium protein, unknown function [Plasmodium gaboni]